MTAAPGPTPPDAARLLVVGGGIAGVSAAEAARKTDPDATVTLISDEDDLPYYRLNLTRYLAGDVEADDLALHPRAWYDERRIDLRPGTRVASIAPDDGTVTLDDGATLPFDRLVLATGARPAVPPIAGTDKGGVTCLRTRDDAERILAADLADRPCLVIGGGLLGLETAAALTRRGAAVTVVEGLEHLIPLQLTREGANVLRAHLEGLGIRVVTGRMIESLAGDGRVREAVLDDGTRLEADLVVISTGVVPNLHLANTAGLDTGGGVLVDDRLATSHPAVYAAGDGTEHRGVLYGLWQASRLQGQTAGQAAAGAPDAAFTGIPPAYILKVVGVDVFSLGAIAPDDPACRIIEGRDDGTYRRFVFRDGRLEGAILLGDTTAMPQARQAIERGADCAHVIAHSLTAADVARGLMDQP